MSIFDDYGSPTSAPTPPRRKGRGVPWIGIAAAAGIVLLAVLILSLMSFGNSGSPSATEEVEQVQEGIEPLEDSPAPAPEVDPGEEDSAAESDNNDLYAPPSDLGALIDAIHGSTVTIFCGESQGSGWAIELGAVVADLSPEEQALEEDFPYEIITNHHVIEECVEDPFSLEAQVEDVVLDAYLYSWDIDNDLAVVAIKQDVPTLPTSRTPQPGWWAMAVGTPYGLEGSIAVGNVMNTDGTDVVSTAPLNAGMSGGPLVNSRGEVMGTNAWFYLDDEIQDWNVAVGLPALCDALVDCDSGDYWSD